MKMRSRTDGTCMGYIQWWICGPNSVSLGFYGNKESDLITKTGHCQCHCCRNRKINTYVSSLARKNWRDKNDTGTVGFTTAIKVISNHCYLILTDFIININYCCFVSLEWISQSNITSNKKPEIWYVMRSPLQAKYINNAMFIEDL